MSEKTEQPTTRRLRKAREEGDTPISVALTQALAFTAAVALAPAALTATAVEVTALLETALASGHAATTADIVRLVIALSVPLLLAAGAAALFTAVAQTGGGIAIKNLVPQLGRANPLTGLKNLFNLQRLLGLLRSLVAAALVAWLALAWSIDHAADVAAATGSLDGAMRVSGHVIHRLLWLAAGVGLALAGLDVLVSRRAWLKRWMMTKEEVKREHKESEGDPELKAARRRAPQELLHSATIAAVKDATVLIINPTHLATALRYNEDDDEAPRVVSQGMGLIAQQMIDAARAYGIPIIRDVPVARALRELEVGDEIPEVLYEAVAEILREIWQQETGDPHTDAG